MNATAKTADPSVVLWRDAAYWCPYCQAVEIALGERAIDHVVEVAPMRCYGAKPRAFLDLVGDGTMPVLVVDGVVYPSSRSALAKVCDEARGARAGDGLRPLAPGQPRRGALPRGADAARRFGGDDFFGGAAPSCADAAMAPTLERAAAVAGYWKGDASVAGGGVELALPGAPPRHAMLQAWADRFERRGHWRRADWYTHGHSLPAQLGGQSFASVEIRGAIDGHRASREANETARRAAAAALAGNAEACVRFAARGCRRATRRKTARGKAPLADPDVVSVPGVARPSTRCRIVVARLLADEGADALAADAARVLPAAPAAAAMAYLRDRVGVPRDMPHAEAHELRRALAWLHDVLLGADLKRT
ncbi:glutathione S-transferase [Aureococcus anophagefferens]|nr:glutathione S-transferase [Aureococcus anophagefferens]